MNKEQRQKLARIIYQELLPGNIDSNLMRWDYAYDITNRLIKEGYRKINDK